MQKNNENTNETLNARLKRNVTVFGNLRLMCLAAILAAMSILLGKFLQIPNPFQNIIRISFENLPIIMAGIIMGPLAGGMVGAVADVLGCLFYGYTINPIITLGAFSIGFMAGVVSHYIARRPLALKAALSVILSHLVGSVLIKSAGLAAWYLASYDMGFWELVAWRALNYGIISVCEIAVIFLLFKNRAFSSQIERLCKRK